MADQRVIAVVGATGVTAGGLVRAILDDPSADFSCRALTREPDSDAARALAEHGVEIARCDLDDERSLAEAFDGAYAAFCATNFFQHFSAERETRQAANQARAAKTAGIRHAIWSTMEDTRDWFPLDDDRMPTLMGTYKVPMWDAKADGNRFFAESGVPTTFLLTSQHWETFYDRAAPRRGDDGVLAITLPLGDLKLPGIAAEDIGRCAYGIFKAGDELVGKTVGVAGEHLSGAETAARLGDALGEEVRYYPVPIEVFRSFPVPGVELGANMFQFIASANEQYCANRDVGVSRTLNPRLQTLAEWLAVNKDKIPV